MITVKAEGDGFSAVYRLKRQPDGFCFVQQDGTYLTPGIGRPMRYSSWLDLWAAVRSRRGIKLTVREFYS